jgi:hypothetical protein
MYKNERALLNESLLSIKKIEKKRGKGRARREWEQRGAREGWGEQEECMVVIPGKLATNL